MRASVVAALFTFGLGAATADPSVARAAETSSWIAQSNAYTQMLLDIELKHSPEMGSHEGLARFDKLVSIPTLADELAWRNEVLAVLGTLKTQQNKETNPFIKQDLAILAKAFDIKLRSQDYALHHDVSFRNASESIFEGLRTLLDDQVSAERRPDAVIRLRKYAGLDSGFRPYTALAKQRGLEQMAKPGVTYPSKQEIETELGRNANYLTGIADLFKKYGITGWEQPYATLKDQLTAYDAWVRATILPKARTDFRLPPEEYALAFEGYGIDLSPSQISAMAHQAFSQYQGEMADLAKRIAKEKSYSNNDYRAVIAALKKQQLTGDAILPFYERRLKEIEKIIAANDLVTLPSRPAIIKLATAAETAQQPAPHMEGPAFLHNTGQRGVFVLPLNIPSANGKADDKYDDFTFDDAAWTLTAHEARPGHELQFDAMVEHGVSLARALYAFNSTNVEGWGLYAEYVMQPFEPIEGQLITLQFRLLRAARAFLDPDLQSGGITPDQAYHVLEDDVGLSHAFAKEEVERFTYRMPGQANSYFYGFTKLLALRREAQAALGEKFNQKKFHDFVLDQGLLPPDLMRKAVMETFVPAQG